MRARLMGVETEYAVSGVALDYFEFDPEDFVYRIIELTASRHRTLPDMGEGVFLENSSRLYVDYGLHPELSTPECDDPRDLVRYILAGERMLVDAVDQAGREKRIEPMIFKSNVDYSGSRSTWGCHESHLHRMSTMELSKQIMPHLVSRVIYTGAGGFNSFAPGVEFTLSPRAPHMTAVTSENSTSYRGIFHTKDESLSSEGYHRLHLLCGESLSSETAMFLKAGTTALIVAMAEAGLRPGEAVALDFPLDALRIFSTDAECAKTVMTTDGKRLTALEIQCHYLDLAEKHASDHFMPVWAGDVCREWRRVLNHLLESPVTMNTTLDWAIKLSLYRNHARSRGMNWDRLQCWNHALRRINRAIEEKCPNRQVSIEFILGSDSPVRDEVNHLAPFLRDRGFSWDDLNSVLALRQELFEIDTRFSQLGGRGIFSALDQAGVLTHHIEGVDRIEEAMSDPPPRHRARLRGEAIKRLSGNNGRYKCDWSGIWDFDIERYLDLSDPFETRERWTSMPK
ncbi:MAG: proteasome accessory factor PafA2 family protein [Acidobacteriota bacterium]